MELRRCGRCGESKPLEDFAWRRMKKGQRHNYCRPCHAAYHREHYLKNREKYISLARKRSEQELDKRMEFLARYLSEHPCVDCGETDPVVLEFDHLSSKSFNVAAGIRNNRWKDVLAEMSKCEVVCANCHRRRTTRRGNYRRMHWKRRPTQGRLFH